MKHEIRLALLCLATASVPGFAQSASPMCGTTNYDQAHHAYTIVNAAARTVNQQCFVTVYPSGAVPDQARQDPNSYIAEGKYIIELVGGGGGGGGGAGAKGNSGEGGGGGAGAAPSRTVQYLSPGVYKLTIGTGGYGGAAHGGHTGDGNPSSLTNAETGQLVAGFAGADVWTQKSEAAGSAAGGIAAPGGTSGASGQPNVTTGGNGGASIGAGGTDAPAGRNEPAEAGSRGGPGLIRLTMSEPARQAAAPAPAPMAMPMPMIHRYTLSTDTLFGFGKSTLKPSGEAKLDDLADKLRQVNIESITDTGHADRIGSTEMNQELSLSRAESVKAYLVSKGVPSDRISVAGKGKSEPVTSADDCKGPATAKVIACLAPDRRVDIEVVGTSKVAGMN